MRAWITFLVLAVSGCSCGGDDDVTPICTVSTDCPDGRVCRDEMCVLAPDADMDTAAPPDTNAPDTTVGMDTEPACESALFCGSPPMCCPLETECVDGACLPVCESGVRCGADDLTCCGAGEVCVDLSCTEPGEACTDSFDCPPDTFCEPTLGRCLPQFDPVMCESEPVFGDFEAAEERAFTTSTTRPDCFHAISSPVVVDLDGDGVPELLSNMTCDSDWRVGLIRAYHGDTGEELWVTEAVTNGRTSIGAADLRGDSVIVTVTLTSSIGTDPNRLIAFGPDGVEIWRSTTDGTTPLTVVGENGAPTFADLDGDGVSEIVFGAVVLDADGELVWQRDRGGDEGTNRGYRGGLSAVADIDLDGMLEVVSGQRAYERDGTPKWTSPASDGYPAIANFDDDPQPEVVLVGDGNVYLLDGMTGAIQWGPVVIPGGGRGGPPTVADFDGDGLPEIGVAGGASYGVYDPDGDVDILWLRDTIDESSNATGSSVFDFEGDGIAEVVYQDECYVRVYRGTDGEVLLEIPSSNATIHEFPIVVDVDADGNSEIIVIGNDRAPSIITRCQGLYPGWDGAREGVFVYGDARDQWVGTRKVWNQHTYHITNTSSAGEVPVTERNNWEVEGLNNYRQNSQGEGVFNAPNLSIIGIEAGLEGCPTSIAVRARVQNIGALGVPTGVPVSLYAPDVSGTLLGTVATAVDLLPGASTLIEFVVMVDDLGESPFAFTAVADDDGAGGSVIGECVEDDNADSIDDISCGLLI